MVRRPGRIPAGQVANDIFSHQDLLPPLLAAAGEPEIKQKLRAGEGARREMVSFIDDGDLAAMWVEQWKIHRLIQEAHGPGVWERPFTTLRFPQRSNLRSDPCERAHDWFDDGRWRVEHALALVPAQAVVALFLETFRELPPRQAPGTLGIGDAMARFRQGAAGRCAATARAFGDDQPQHGGDDAPHPRVDAPRVAFRRRRLDQPVGAARAAGANSPMTGGAMSAAWIARWTRRRRAAGTSSRCGITGGASSPTAESLFENSTAAAVWRRVPALPVAPGTRTRDAR